MSGYRALRTLRIVLWGAFLAALFLAVPFRESDGSFAAIVRYAPPVMLVLALLAGLAERIVRTRHGLPSQSFLRPRSD